MLNDRDRKLIQRAISVTGRAQRALPDSGATAEQMFLAQQISGLGDAVERMLAGLLAGLGSHSSVYQMGREDVEAESREREAPRLRLVSG